MTPFGAMMAWSAELPVTCCSAPAMVFDAYGLCAPPHPSFTLAASAVGFSFAYPQASAHLIDSFA